MEETPPRDGLGQLIDRLSEIVDGTGAWAMSTDELMAALGVAPVRFWRAVHAVRGRIDFAEAVDGFCQESVGDLVTLLEQLAGPDAEAVLTRAGFFLPNELRVDLMDSLLRDGWLRSATHDIDTDEFSAMLKFAGSVRRAISIYLDEHADIDSLIETRAEAFRAERGLPWLGRATAARYLRSLFARHVLDQASMFSVLADRLRLAAARLGWFEAEEPREDARGGRADGRGTAGAGPTAARQSVRLAWARRIMGFVEEPVTAEELRARYRELVMRYHPDANPSGLERCKDVNAAYAILMSGNARPG
jgi:hypothetical protein